MGYLSFSRRTHRDNLVIAGVDFGVLPPPVSWAADPPLRLLQTRAGTTVVQAVSMGADAPLDLSALEIELEVTAQTQAQFDAIAAAVSATSTLRIYVGAWWRDTWSIAAAASGQTTWQTSRRPAWGLLPSIVHATHPPEVTVDGVAQTVLTSGTPSTGEVVVPTSIAATAATTTITTPVLAGTEVAMVYPVEWVGVVEAEYGIAEVNALDISLTIREHLGGRYALVTP